MFVFNHGFIPRTVNITTKENPINELKIQPVLHFAHTRRELPHITLLQAFGAKLRTEEKRNWGRGGGGRGKTSVSSLLLPSPSPFFRSVLLFASSQRSEGLEHATEFRNRILSFVRITSWRIHLYLTNWKRSNNSDDFSNSTNSLLNWRFRWCSLYGW